jgi:hypothetical protein
MDDMRLLSRLEKVEKHDLNFKPRDNVGSLCPTCNWPILMRPEFDFPERSESSLEHGDKVFCICGEEYSCEFCGTQLTWGVEKYENFQESSKIFGDIQERLGVDVTTTRSSAVIYTVCEFNHPQGPLPRPGRTVQRWWRDILQLQGDTEWDEGTYNRLMACFEVYFKIGLSIGAVQVGMFLAWHLSCEDMNRTAQKVLQMVRTLTPSLDDEKRICHEMDAVMLGLYVRIRTSYNENGSSSFDDFATEIDKTEANLAELALDDHEPNGAPQFLHHIKEFIQKNSQKIKED